MTVKFLCRPVQKTIFNASEHKIGKAALYTVAQDRQTSIRTLHLLILGAELHAALAQSGESVHDFCS